MHPTPGFVLNGRRVALDDVDGRESLLRWLNRQRLTGTKEGCGDGDCGACTVAVVERDADGRPTYHAVNSCLLPIGQLVGRELLTVDALADGEQLHPAQQALVECAGSQCGYCTPGIVMSLFVGQQRGELDDSTTEGNLCRCTGYRPIRAATALLRELAVTAPPVASPAASADPPLGERHLAPMLVPETVDQALALKQARPTSRWISGATDLGLEFSRGRPVAETFVAIDRIAELHALQIEPHHVTIGAAVSLSRVERELAGQFPALDAMLHGFAARQVRNRATFGGNLGTASPIGDLLPVLLALDAEIELAGAAGRRWQPVDGFFVGYRQTERADDELIVRVRLPRRPIRNAAYKVAKRQTDDISIVAAAYALALDPGGRVCHIRMAYGGVAAVPLRARRTEQMLLGQTLTIAVVEHARQSLHDEFSPLSDHRASADYRRALAGNLFARFARELVA